VSDILVDAIKLIVPALIGLLGGYFIKRSEVNYHARKAASDIWETQKQTHWSPLLRSCQELRERFEYLRDLYTDVRDDFKPENLSADFRELYALSRDEIECLERVDANGPRRKSDPVQTMRTRVCHQLTFAESSLYITARYLGNAERVRRSLNEYTLILPKRARSEMTNLVSNVRQSLQGPGGAGLFEEQQEYMGEAVLGTTGRVVSNIEFRKMLFELPGWEQFANLLRFFADFKPKVDYQIVLTIKTLEPLEKALEQLCGSSEKEYKMLWHSPPAGKWHQMVQGARIQPTQ
jgi:hypothetical protein